MQQQALILATRKSPMALVQAQIVKKALQASKAASSIEVLAITTQGDRQTDRPLKEIGGKALFVKALQTALLNQQADIAVHCVKDLSVQPIEGLTLAAIYARDDPRDAFISNHYRSYEALPLGACVGTGSPRRLCLLQSLRPDLVIQPIRGNVHTRLHKLDAGQYDALILSAAGLCRLSLQERIRHYFSLEHFIPAIGQGAIGIECRSQDHAIIQWLASINHKASEYCIKAERAVNEYLGGDCYTPMGAYATIEGAQLSLRAVVGDLKTQRLLWTQVSGAFEKASAIGKQAAMDLLDQGAAQLLGMR